MLTLHSELTDTILQVSAGVTNQKKPPGMAYKPLISLRMIALDSKVLIQMGNKVNQYLAFL